MSHKSQKIAVVIEQFQGQELDAHYLGYFDCFNRQLFYEAHDVLEELWLGDRHGPDGAFYKGLIQLAGAFVHLQKQRPGPAAALFRLAQGNLAKYPSTTHRLDLAAVGRMMETWLERLRTAASSSETLPLEPMPRLHLLPPAPAGES